MVKRYEIKDYGELSKKYKSDGQSLVTNDGRLIFKSFIGFFGKKFSHDFSKKNVRKIRIDGGVLVPVTEELCYDLSRKKHNDDYFTRLHNIKIKKETAEKIKKMAAENKKTIGEVIEEKFD